MDTLNTLAEISPPSLFQSSSPTTGEQLGKLSREDSISSSTSASGYVPAYNRACLWVSHNALFWKSQTHSENDSIYDFNWVFVESPVKNYIVGMLLTCTYWWTSFKQCNFICKYLYTYLSFSANRQCNAKPIRSMVFACKLSVL